MEFNYFKTSVVSAMAVGALAFSASMMAAAPVSVNPAPGSTVPSLKSVSLVFNEGAVVAWDVDSDRLPCVYEEGNTEAFTLAGPTTMAAKDNVLTYNLSRVAEAAGKYRVEFPAGSYKVDGVAGEACSYTYTVTGENAGGYTVSPVDGSEVSEIRAVVISFPTAKEVTVLTPETGLTSENAPRLYLVDESGDLTARDSMLPKANFNNLEVATMYVPVTEPGDYVLKVPGTCYFVDGKQGEDITLKYTIVKDSYPEVTITVDPEEGEVDVIDSITITFDGVDAVKWNVTGTENAPYIADMTGQRYSSFTNISAKDNTLTLAMYSEGFDVKGVYQVIIPEGSYEFPGEKVIPGKKLVFDYDVVGVSGIKIEPEVNVLTEIQNFRITFYDAKEVTLPELGTANSPYFELVTEDGQRERRGTLYPSVVGNALLLKTYSEPYYEPGEYIVVIPAGSYLLDGKDGELLEYSYTIVEPSYPEVAVTVNPASGEVETIETIEVTFGGVDLVEWAVTGTENSPYLEDLEGNRWATFAKLGGLGNMLSLSLLNEEFTAKGEYKLVIPEGSYKFQGIYHGMPGKALEFDYKVLGLSGLTVDPAGDVVSEIQYVTITFNEAKEVTLAEDLGTEKTPILYLVTEDNVRERRGTMFPSVLGNQMNLRMNSPIFEEGNYEIEIPGSVYFLDGKEGEDIVLNYKVVAPSYPDVELSVNPATDKVETIETIEVTFGGVDIVEWNVTGTEDAPYLEDLEGNRWATFAKLGGLGNMLSLSLLNEEFTVPGEYKVVIPEGSYLFQGIYHGMPGKEITLNFEVLGLSGMTVEPANNIVSEIQYVTITFNEAKEVTLAEDLGTEKTPILYLVTEDGVRERRGTMFPSVSGNKMNLRMNSPIYDEGDYVIVVPGSVYFLDGNEGEDFELNYKVLAPSYPEVEISVNPATDKVETIETIEVTFDGVDLVEWAVTGTENAPYLVDLDGNRWATFAKLGGLGNMLSLSLLNEEFTVPGEYKVVIPDSCYVFQGIYHGMPGKALEFNYEVLGLPGISIEPASDIVSEIQYVTLTFNEAKEVTLAEDLDTEKSPILYLITEDGVRERRGTMFPSVSGNKMNLRMNSPIYDEGEYVIVLPGSVYFLDGNEGKDEEFYYTIVAPSYPDVELSVNPATDTVETLETIEVTFGGVDIVEWAVTGTENAPYLEDLEGNRWATFAKLGGLGNMLSLSLLNEEFTVPGEYKVVIPEGSYVFQGIYHGMPGKEITLNFEVLGLGGMTVEPATNMVSEIQNVKITFNEAKVVTLAEDLGTENAPILYLVTEEGVRERRGTFFPSVEGNTMMLTMRSPITAEGEYVIVVPGSCYFLDGNEGQTFELGYIVLPNDDLTYDVYPEAGSVNELHTIEITFDPKYDENGNVTATALWNPNATEVPSITCDGAVIDGVQLDNLYSNKNVLYAAINTVQPLKTNGYYIVTIPGASYVVDGKEGVDIVLAYNLDATGVKAIFGENVNVDVYDINGRVVVRNADAEAIKALRGVYVIGGKKFILR